MLMIPDLLLPCPRVNLLGSRPLGWVFQRP